MIAADVRELEPVPGLEVEMWGDLTKAAAARKIA